MNVKDLTYDFENEVFYFFTLAEKSVYRYNLNTGSVQAIADKIEGYTDDKSIGRMISVDAENFVFIKSSPFEFLIIDGENFSKFAVPICEDYQMKATCPTHIGRIFSFHVIGPHLLLLITSKGFLQIYDYTDPRKTSLILESKSPKMEGEITATSFNPKYGILAINQFQYLGQSKTAKKYVNTIKFFRIRTESHIWQEFLEQQESPASKSNKIIHC